MKHAKVQSLRSLREEMKAVARGERPAPADARKTSFNSVEAVVRLLAGVNSAGSEACLAIFLHRVSPDLQALGCRRR